MSANQDFYERFGFSTEEEIVAALNQLALREERIYQATHDLHTKKNQ